jgi:hypothetical protein
VKPLRQWLGYTYSEEHRHECEVRWVLALPSREARRAYIEGGLVDGRSVKGVRQHRGDVAADKLIHDVRAAWQQRQAGAAWPRSPAELEIAGAAASRSLHAVNDGAPVDGSFLAPADAGDSAPEQSVVSGGSAG